MKVTLVVLILVALVVARRLHLRRQTRLQERPTGPSPRVPHTLLDGAQRTWVVFTTPYCASCGPVQEQLAASDPGARIVTVDATREPHLADAFAIRSAPTAVLADAAGVVTARLVGAPAVRDYVSALPGTA